MDQNRMGAAEVRRLLSLDKTRDEAHNQWVVHFLLRPLSVRLSPLLIRAGIGANAVTLAGLALSVTLPVMALLPPLPGALAIAVAATIFLLTDCMDGDIARATATASRWGGYLDAVTDLVHRFALYVALGLLAQQQADFSWGPLVGAGSAWLSLAARWCRSHREARDAGGDVYARHNAPRPADYIFFFFAGLDQLLPVLLIAAAAAEKLDVLVWGVLAYSLLDFCTTQILMRAALK
jgi:phosphatidylglycerophosphate synthase